MSGVEAFIKATQPCQGCEWYDPDAYRCCIGAGVPCPKDESINNKEVR